MMWPIVLCSIVAAAIILERLWTLQDKRVLPRELPGEGLAAGRTNQVNDKVIAALEQNSPLGRLLATGLANRHRPREMLMERLEDTGRHVVHELERFINTLGTIAGVSPLLGLLGTVTGIIRAFNAIEQGGMGDPRALSGGIAEALIAPSRACAWRSRRSSPTATCAAGSRASSWRWRSRRSAWRTCSRRRGCASARRRPRRPEGAAGRPGKPAVNLKPRRHEEPEINVVSLIDVVLLLVVFFILSSKFTDEGRLRVHLPQRRGGTHRRGGQRAARRVGDAAGRLPRQSARAHQFESRDTARGAAEGGGQQPLHAGDAARRRARHATSRSLPPWTCSGGWGLRK